MPFEEQLEFDPVTWEIIGKLNPINGHVNSPIRTADIVCAKYMSLICKCTYKYQFCTKSLKCHGDRSTLPKKEAQYLNQAEALQAIVIQYADDIQVVQLLTQHTLKPEFNINIESRTDNLKTDQQQSKEKPSPQLRRQSFGSPLIKPRLSVATKVDQQIDNNFDEDQSPGIMRSGLLNTNNLA